MKIDSYGVKQLGHQEPSFTKTQYRGSMHKKSYLPFESEENLKNSSMGLKKDSRNKNHSNIETKKVPLTGDRGAK